MSHGKPLNTAETCTTGGLVERFKLGPSGDEGGHVLIGIFPKLKKLFIFRLITGRPGLAELGKRINGRKRSFSAAIHDLIEFAGRLFCLIKIQVSQAASILRIKLRGPLQTFGDLEFFDRFLGLSIVQ